LLRKGVQESLMTYATDHFTIRQSSAILARSCEAQATEWQRIGNQIDAAPIFAGADFVSVL